MSLRGQGVWILGAGFLGSALAVACRAAGAAVLTIDTAAPADACVDATDAHALAPLLGRVIPRFAFCCLSTRGGDGRMYRQTYEKSVRSLLMVAPSAKPVFCSSVSLYADAGGAAVDESTPVQCQLERHAALLAAEALALQSGGVVARLAPLYGGGRCELLRRHLAGEPRLPGSPERWLNYLHVDDAVTALLFCALSGSGIYNLCSESFTIKCVYDRLRQMTGVLPAADISAPSVRGCANRQIVSRRYQMPHPHRFCDYVAERMLNSSHL